MKGHFARRTVAAALALAFVLVCVSPAVAAPKVDGTFPLVSELDTNNKLVAGPEGDIWVTVSDANKDVARITPSGEVKEFELVPVERPSGIAADPEGNLWVTKEGGVAKFSPSNPVGTAVATAIPQVKKDASIVAGPDGNMWVATEGNLVRFPPSNPAKFVPIPIANLKPKDIDVAGSLLVVADFEPRIVTVTTSGIEKDYTIAGGSQGVAGSPSGQIAFSQQLTEPEQFGLLTPPNAPQTFNVPATDPFGVALGSDGAFWGVQSAKDGVTRITATGQTTFLGGFPAGSMARQIAPGSGNTLWVTLAKPGEFAVGRISGLEPPVVPIAAPHKAPQTKITNGPKKKVTTAAKRAKVRFRFSSTTAGATFQCALTKVKKVKKGQKAAKPKFKTCKSPKTYSLKPGKYRFSVRAVSAGVVDPSAATRSFRVIHLH